MRVSLVNKKNKIHKYYIGFSFLYLILGPIYSLYKKRVFFSFVTICYYLFLIPRSICEKFFTMFIEQETVINVLCAPHFNYDLFTFVCILFITRLLFSHFIANVFLKKDIEKKGLRPYRREDYIKLCKISKKHQELEIYEDELDKINLINDNELVKEKTSSSKMKNDDLKQKQIDIIYHKYHLGLISEAELKELKDILTKE